MSAPLELVLMWHMHQPDYRDYASREFRRPWVLLHAIKDYTDMAGHLERHPGMKCVVNFSPVLLEQIEDYVDQFSSGVSAVSSSRASMRSNGSRRLPVANWSA